jgi:hypothetical protein
MTMPKPFRIQVFGKSGCDKCGVLNERIDKLLAGDDWQDFEKGYADIETEAGIIGFSEAECLNPHRLPAMLLTRLNEATGEYEPVPCKEPGQKDAACGNSRLYQFVGLQTDYGDQGRGLITPKMITAVLREAKGA